MRSCDIVPQWTRLTQIWRVSPWPRNSVWMGVAPVRFCQNGFVATYHRSLTEVGGHAEVSQASGTEDDDGELVEQTGAAGGLSQYCQAGTTPAAVIKLTTKFKPMARSRKNVMSENAAQSQSEPWVLMCRASLGGLSPSASLPAIFWYGRRRC